MRRKLWVLPAAIWLAVMLGCPKPAPDPDPSPGTLAVVVIYETGDRTHEQGVVLSGLQNYLIEQKIGWRYADQHLVDGVTGKTPAWLAPYLDLVAKSKKSYPVLIVKGRVHPFPATTDAAIELVKKGMK